MRGEIERQLKKLVAQFGEQKVLEALGRLITNLNGTIGNAILRIARQT